ncbi:MAG TPA: class I SAM-dependent methyltransferase [Myxococcales bacterium]|nr:class I SAM-dependent methyltransferase [Myxococcales bacterium]
MSVADRVFLETTRRLAPRRFAQEDVHAALQLAQVEAGKPVADLGCGYGRHLRELVQFGHSATGIDRSALLLDEARSEVPGAPLVRGDLRALPLHQGSLAAAFCFYSSMFLGSEEDAAVALVEAARVLRPGGPLVLTTDNPLRLAANPQARAEHDVPGLGRVIEQSRFDGAVDHITKTVQLESGECLTAGFHIRYYAPEALAALAYVAGLRFVRLHEPLTDTTPQMIALLER